MRFFLVSTCLIILIAFSGCIEENISKIYISPSVINQPLGESFSIYVYCNPYVPVKGFEFRLSFNPSIIKAINVIEDDFFSGYETFFNSGIIDNNNGTIINIYGVIMGPGNVTDTGALVKITFEAISVGTTEINFIEDGWTGICNETEYLPLEKSGGIITVV